MKTKLVELVRRKREGWMEIERWGRSDQIRECLRLHQHEFAERTRQRHVLLFVCMHVYV